MKKILFVVLDGLGDQADSELGGETPLSLVDTPRMDELAAGGVCGLLYPVGPGIAPESDIAVISLLGYPWADYYTGRGPIECRAMKLWQELQMDLEPGTLMLRVNFATARKKYPGIKDRRCGRDLSTDEAKALADELNAKIKLESVPGATFEFRSSVEHRGVLAIRAPQPLSGWITNTDPAFKRIGLGGEAVERPFSTVRKCRPAARQRKRGPKLYLDDRDAMQASAELVEEFSVSAHGVLNDSPVNRARQEQKKLPANLILIRDAGDRLPQFPPLAEMLRVPGLRFGCFAEMPVEVGIADLTGMHVVDMGRSTKDYQKDYIRWADAVPENLAKHDGLYVHIKGPDVPGHDGDRLKKAVCIRAIDKHFFERLLPQIDLKSTVLVVTADHATPCQKKGHSGDAVPVMIVTEGLKPDAAQAFSEAEAAKGSLGELMGVKGEDAITGPMLMPKLAEIARAFTL